LDFILLSPKHFSLGGSPQSVLRERQSSLEDPAAALPDLEGRPLGETGHYNSTSCLPRQFGTFREANHVTQANEPLAHPVFARTSTPFARSARLLAKAFMFKSKQLAGVAANQVRVQTLAEFRKCFSIKTARM
jgi:hypothetical protein